MATVTRMTDASRTKAEKKAIKTLAEPAYNRAKIELMQSMLTSVVYATGASYLFHRKPVMFGSTRYLEVVGIAIYLIAVHCVFCSVELFLDALVVRHPWFRTHRVFFLLMALPIGLALASVPCAVAFGNWPT